jgi:quercetin dioxygenase-like cupin family protein
MRLRFKLRLQRGRSFGGFTKKVVIVGLVLGAIAGGAYAAAGEIDPTTVPDGFLALGNRAPDSFKLKVGQSREHVYRNGAEVTVQHVSIPAGASSGWHSHAGVVFVQVVSGTATLYEVDDPTCSPRQVPAGTGFVEPGFGNVHDLRNEGSTTIELYAVYVLPPGTTATGLFTPLPPNSNPACPFAS